MANSLYNSPIIFKIPNSTRILQFPKKTINTDPQLNIHDIIKPIYCALGFALLWPFRYSKNNKIEPLTKIHKFWALVLMTTIIIYFLFSTFNKVQHYLAAGFAFVAVTDVAYALSAHMIITISIGINNFKSGNLTEQFFLELEKFQHDKIILMGPLKKRTLYHMLTISIIGMVFIFVNAIISLIIVGLRDIRDFFSSYLVQILFMLLFLEINVKIDLLLKHFQGINEQILSYNNSFTWKLRELSRIHGKLCNLINLINEEHGWQFAFFVIVTASKILNSLQLTVIDTTQKLYGDVTVLTKVILRTAQISTTVFHCGLLLILAAKCSLTKREAYKAGLLANDILLQIPAGTAETNLLFYKEELRLLIDQISYRNPHFSAAGLFNVDYTIIATVLGVVTSYFIVFLQFF